MLINNNLNLYKKVKHNDIYLQEYNYLSDEKRRS
jgi:hypothetical protein